jgi:transposase InsO family protein
VAERFESCGDYTKGIARIQRSIPCCRLEYFRTVSSRGCFLSYWRRGEPGDNALRKSFFSRLKVEWEDVFIYARSLEELQELVDRAIAYYNDERYHSSLEYRTPLAFVNDFLTSHKKPVQAIS